MENNFVGVILGGDMNSYAVARAFFEAYKIKTIVLGKYPLYPTTHSKLIEAYYNNNLLNEEIFLNMLKDIDKKYPDKKKIILSNTDYYVQLVIHNKEKILKLSNNFIVPTIDEKLFKTLFNKADFYQLCDKYDLPHPKTIIYDFKKDNLGEYKMIIPYPVFMKPSNTDKYTRLEFVGRQKGYLVKDDEEFKRVIGLVKDSGYHDKFIIQEYIDSLDDDMYVYTFYASSKNKVQVMTAGKILMHDRSPELIGNYNAITNHYNEELSLKLKDFVEKIKYVGIGHFDVIYDRNKKCFLVFEINIRQGRSNMYTLASGVNLMEYIVDDYIKNINKPFLIANKPFVVSILSKRNLIKSIGKIDTSNFYRFTIAPYDRNLLRYYYQYRWDKKILNGYKNYNRR